MKPITLIVTYCLRADIPNAAESFLSEIAASGLLQQIRAEDGCMEYDYALPYPADGRVLLIERWESKEKQKAHLAGAHMAQLKNIKDAYVSDTIVECFFEAG